LAQRGQHAELGTVRGGMSKHGRLCHDPA
jgi:hypothetical protein